MNLILTKPETIEVVNWLKSEHLLHLNGSPVCGSTIINRMVMVRGLGCVIPNKYDFVEDALIWKDIVTKKHSELYDISLDADLFLQSERLLSELLLPIIQHQLPTVYSTSSLGMDLQIQEDMVAICESRYRYGIRPGTFFENMFEAYRTGGLPCGWDGIYPNGRMIVYYATDVGHKPILWRDEGSDETDERYDLLQD